MRTAPVRPIKVEPHLDPKPWGGRRLETWGITLPPREPIGEALLTAPEAIVSSSQLEGLSLSEVAERDPKAWIGRRGLAITGNRPIFPLLVKLIDGHADLSIQVHPDDRAAAAAGLGTGKTEAYHILEATPGSVIYLGLDEAVSREEFAASCLRSDASAARCLRQVPAEAGMTVLIPARTPHALGAGIVLYEIQQPSNVTFRLDDWGRLDALGRSRVLHHDQGLAVIDAHSRPEPIPLVRLDDPRALRVLLVATPYFALERITLDDLHGAKVSAVDSPQVLTPVAGSALVDVLGWVSSITIGETLIVPAGMAATLTGRHSGVVLRGWVPDLEHDVIAPARAAGHSDATINQLGVCTRSIGGEGDGSGTDSGTSAARSKCC